MISETEQSRMKHRVSIVLVVMAFPFFILCIVFEDMPCLKISSYSDMFFLANVLKNGLYEIMCCTLLIKNDNNIFNKLNILNKLTILVVFCKIVFKIQRFDRMMK